MLDAEGEWCYDATKSQIKVWLESCNDPNKVKFRGKVRSYLLNLTASSSSGSDGSYGAVASSSSTNNGTTKMARRVDSEGSAVGRGLVVPTLLGDDRSPPPPSLTLRNITLFAGTFSAPHATLVLDNVKMLHPQANQRVLGEAGDTAASTILDFNSARGTMHATGK